VFKTAVIAPTDATVTFIPKPSNVPKLRIALAILVQFTFLPLFKVYVMLDISSPYMFISMNLLKNAL
jgi:hypothetical protein